MYDSHPFLPFLIHIFLLFSPQTKKSTLSQENQLEVHTIHSMLNFLKLARDVEMLFILNSEDLMLFTSGTIKCSSSGVQFSVIKAIDFL